MITAIGFSLAWVMGLTLGLIGAGGSMLTVPILVYCFGIKPIIATGYSLLVVGSTAAVGAVNYWRNDKVSIPDALVFAVPAMLMVLLTRSYILPSIPDIIFDNGRFILQKDLVIMSIFGLLMLVSGFLMLTPLKIEVRISDRRSVLDMLKLIIGSASVGLLTGLVGAGGGFLIIPALITLFGLQMKEAIGTSLTIIAINSLIGFRGDVIRGIHLDWHILGFFLILTLLGMMSGIFLGKHLNGDKLKRVFAVFTLLIGSSIIYQEWSQLF